MASTRIFAVTYTYLIDRDRKKKRWLEFRINFEMEFCVSWIESLLHVQTCASTFSANCSLHSTSHYYLAIKFNGISPQVISIMLKCFTIAFGLPYAFEKVQLLLRYGTRSKLNWKSWFGKSIRRQNGSITISHGA